MTLDTNASGAGWYVAPATPATSQFNLLTVVTHEIGHLLGYGHSSDRLDVMAATLSVGARRLPGIASLITQDILGSVLSSPLLVPGPLRNGTRSDLLDHEVMPNDLDHDTGADMDPLLLSLASAGYVDRSRVRSEAVEIRMLNDITDEETELLDEDLLAPIAAGQN